MAQDEQIKHYKDKEIFEFLIWIKETLMFILNLPVSLCLVDAGSVKLTIKQEQALAADCDVIWTACSETIK